MAFSPDGRRLAVAASDGERGRIELFSVPDALEPPEDVKLIQGKEVQDRTTDRLRKRR